MSRRHTRPYLSHRVARRFALAAQVAMAVFVLLLWFTPMTAPHGGTLGQLLWTAAHKRTFYILIGLFAAAVVLSLLAWQRRGGHRLWLVGGWVLFICIAAGRFGHELGVMIRVIWRQVT